jgi:mono/diheme cytochrome c family protein
MTRILPLFLVCASTAGAQEVAPAYKAKVKPFLETHCIECHGPVTKKANLTLNDLKPDFADSEANRNWVHVLDKLVSGQMPPPKRERPAKKDLDEVTTWLRNSLHQASLAKQQSEGRVVLRRLNRIEYETTLRDLLGVNVDVKDMLPEDGTSAGFDNISSALETSSVHLLRYQEAADKALRAAIPTRGQPESFKNRRTGKQVTQAMMRFFKDLIGKSVRLDGDRLLQYTRTYSYIPVQTASAPVAGRYKVRCSVQALNTDGKPLPLLMVCREEYGRDDKDVRAVRDVPADKPTVIEIEVDLPARKGIVFLGWTLPSEAELVKLKKGVKLENYTGPGLAYDWVEIEGPLDVWPPVGYQRLFGDLPGGKRSGPTGKKGKGGGGESFAVTSARPREDAERLIRAFLPVAFRRPVEEKLQQYYVKMAHDALDQKVPFAEAVLLAYRAALCSPHFLFLIEPVDFAGKKMALDDYAIASRLSYFLWSSPPDKTLMDLAAKKELQKPAVRHAQVERMLGDPKAKRFTDNFAGQWLDLRLLNATTPDPAIYTEFDDFLYWSMPRETEMFFEEILAKDRSLFEFVDSDWTFLNQRLAQHYGIKGIFGAEMRKVKLPPDCHRGGVLTQALVLKVTADGTRTSPIIRGKWVLDRIVGLPPSPPPPGTPAIDPDIRGATTIRQQLDKHRHTAACAACHQHIDPPGFALENFDAIGGWRDFYRSQRPLKQGAGQVALANYPGRRIYRGLEVEKGGELPDGRKFKNIDEYKQLLLTDKDQLARNLAQKLLTYSTGADIQFADREVVEQLVALSRQKNYGFRSLIHDVVETRVFLSK